MSSAPVACVDRAESDRDPNRGLPCSKRLQRGSLDTGDLAPLSAGQLDHPMGSRQARWINWCRLLSAEVRAANGAAGAWV